MLFFTTIMVLPFVFAFFVRDFSVSVVVNLLVKRGLMLVGLMFLALASTVAGVLATAAGLELHQLAWVLLSISVNASIVGFIVLFFVTFKDLWSIVRFGRKQRKEGIMQDQEGIERENAG